MTMTPAQAAAADLARRLRAVEQQVRQIPSRYGRGGGVSATTPIWQIIDGQLLTYLGRQGIYRRADTVAASELPAGAGGVDGQITAVPAWPMPTGLPDGVGVARMVNSGVYSFVVHDARQAVASADLVAGELLLADSTVDLDVVDGDKTYRYTCIIPAPGWW